MPYCVVESDEAMIDIIEVYNHISQHLFSPAAAETFLRNIYACIASLETNAAIYAVSIYRDVLRYGENARSINCKGFTVIYTIHGRYVLIHRIMHGSLIKE